MPEIVYDGRKVSVPAGTNLVDAGARAGISVPIFCYHHDLGAIGSCRICAVTVKQADKSRMVMACMTDAADGMEVTTLDPQSREMRRWVTEWLMVNHPHDCPICDEGGECQLQDLTIATGHSIRRTELKKRTFVNQYLGEFISHEMNRCITCYRCSRFYQEYAGGRDFGSTGSRNRVYFGRFEDGPLESPFSGNLVEFCPTGVFTDKLFRYRSRVWDLEMAPSICPHCSVGCNVLPGARHRELQRVRMRENRAVNGSFLCDRGQFGHGYVNAADRPATRTLNGEPAEFDSATALVGGTLAETARRHGGAAIALIASSRASLETHFALRELASGPLQGARIAHFDDAERETRALANLEALRAAGAAPLEQSDIAHCDVLLIAGTSLVDEAPLAALAARQVARRGGRVFVVGPVERYLNDVATLIAVAPAELDRALADIGKRAGSRPAGNGAGAPAPSAAPSHSHDAHTEAPLKRTPEQLRDDLAAALAGAQRPGVLVGCDLMSGEAIAAAGQLVGTLGAGGRAVRFGAVFPGPNGFGAAALSSQASLAGIQTDLEAGKFQAAVVVESELSSWTPRARQALEQLPLLVVLDYLPGPLVGRAHAFFPTTVTYEANGLYVNRAGRIQGFARARAAGRSVELEIVGGSFRRSYQRAATDSDPRDAWSVLESVRAAATGQGDARGLADLREALAASHPAWAPARTVRAGDDGAAIDVQALAPRNARVAPFGEAKGARVHRIDRTLGSEVLSRRSAAMQKAAGGAPAWLSRADAKRLGVDGRVSLAVDGSVVEIPATAVEMAEGVVLVPRDVEWPIMPAPGAAVTIAAAQQTAEAAR